MIRITESCELNHRTLSHAALSLNAVGGDLGPDRGRALLDRGHRPAACYQCIYPIVNHFFDAFFHASMRGRKSPYASPSGSFAGIDMRNAVFESDGKCGREPSTRQMDSTIPLRRDLTHLDGPEMNHFPRLRVHFRDHAVRVQSSHVPLGLQLGHAAMKFLGIPLPHDNRLSFAHAQLHSAAQACRLQFTPRNLRVDKKKVCDADHICGLHRKDRARRPKKLARCSLPKSSSQRRDKLLRTVPIPVLLAGRLRFFLTIVAVRLEWLARGSHPRSLQCELAGFKFHCDFDRWECPVGRQLHIDRSEVNPERSISRYKASAHACNACATPRRSAQIRI